MASIYKEQGRPGLPFGMKWASNAPFLPIGVGAVEDVGSGWSRQRFMAYRTNPEAPGSLAQPHVYYAYTNEGLHPGITFWACYGVGTKEVLAGMGLIALTAGIIYFAGKAKRRR